MYYIIEKYVNNLTINNINDFALKNNIILSENEQILFYDMIKKHWMDILNGNDKDIIDNLHNKLTESTFNSVMNLYNVYKNKYLNYL